MSELKNCPFCGSEDVEHLPDGFGNWLVGCVTCDYRIQCVSCTEDEAIGYWNTRPAEDALRAENKELCSTICGMEKTIGRAEKVLGEHNLLTAEVERLKEALKRIAYYRDLNPNIKATEFAADIESEFRNFYCTMGDIAKMTLGTENE